MSGLRSNRKTREEIARDYDALIHQHQAYVDAWRTANRFTISENESDLEGDASALKTSPNESKTEISA